MIPAVVVVGSYVQDLTWRCAAFPREGETVVGQFATGPGGKGSNQAVAAARAGAATCFIGAVGRDPFAASARAFYRRERIAARFAGKSRHATGTAAILVNAAGQNEIIVALGANAVLARADVDAALLRRARVVVTQLESNLATTAHVLRLARRAGVTTILNPAPMRPDFNPALLRDVDVLIPNEPEFVALANLTGAVAALYESRDGGPFGYAQGRLRPPLQQGSLLTEDMLKALTPGQLHAACRRLGVPTVIVTLGAQGCFVSRAAGHVTIAGHTGMRIVDTTGAGDAFIGAFAAGLVKFAGEQEAAARFANAAAALSVTKRGTAPAMPRALEIARFLRRG